jgi:hypothetical protein
MAAQNTLSGWLYHLIKERQLSASSVNIAVSAVIGAAPPWTIVKAAEPPCPSISASALLTFPVVLTTLTGRKSGSLEFGLGPLSESAKAGPGRREPKSTFVVGLFKSLFLFCGQVTYL